MILAASQYGAGKVSLAGCLLIILLSADFFIPMRQLGSFFHVAMNGMAASEKIFRLLDLEETEEKVRPVPADCTVRCGKLRFSYEEGREILHGIDIEFPMGSFTALVGESGCGKSTVAGILMGRNQNDSGTVTVGGEELSSLSEADRMRKFTYVGHQSYLFKGTVRENLQMGCREATERQLWAVLDRVNLSAFLKGENGLDTMLTEKGANLSGGQCQRLALA